MSPEQLKGYIETVPDFPTPGIRFRDITPLLASPLAFSETVRLLGERIGAYMPDAVIAIEARGFPFAGAICTQMELPLLPVRKRGKLPRDTVSAAYDLEYGSDVLELHADVLERYSRLAVVDDLLATGGTAAAVTGMLSDRGAEIACCAFVVELEGLGGRESLAPYTVESLVRFSLDE